MTENDLEQIKARYTDLLIKQYKEKPKAIETIKLFVDLFLQNGFLFDLKKILDVDIAKGKSLDMIGKIVGIDRSYKGLLLQDKIYFALGDGLVDPTAKYKSFGDGIIEGSFVNEDTVASREILLGDDDYRILIKLKIISNGSELTELAIEETMNLLFGNNIAIETGAMSLTYKVKEPISNIINIAKEKNALPKPMGVELIINLIV